MSEQRENCVRGGMMVESSSARYSFVPKSLRLILLASLTIAAILLGLLGMHALSIGPGPLRSGAAHGPMLSLVHSPPPQMGAVSTESALPSVVSAAPVSVGVVSAQSCVGLCAMNCFLLGMVCALSFLVALIGLLLSKILSPPLSALQKMMRIPRIDMSKFVLPSTPSLHTLSISRT